MLVGVARVTNIGGPTEYKTAKGAPFSGLLWENMVAHSLRPDFSDGFLLPYHAAIRMTEQDPDFDLTQVLAVPPEDRRLEFSYGTEHVSNDAALRSLLACAAALNNAKRGIPGPWDQCLDWIDSRLLEVETLRGPCPGLGAALSAFGVEQAALIARELQAKAGDNEDPWPVAEKVFKSAGSVLPPALQSKIGPTLKDIWKSLEPERKVLLKLVSRFELTKEQAALIYVREKRAKVGITATDEQIIKNPYVIFELTRDKVEPVSVFTIDAGVFPDTTIREKHPLPSSSRVDESIDVRRVRAFTVELLEQGAAAGNTLLARADVVNSIRDLKLKPPCPATGDSLSVAEKIFAGIVDKAQAADSSPAYQLARLSEAGNIIRTAVLKRASGKRHSVKQNWRDLLDKQFKNAVPDEQEKRARSEKTLALEELAASRFSVLIGPAGTGKTSLLATLCQQTSIAQGKVLFLAPTGKARVQMQQECTRLGLNITALTLAQHLSPERYDWRTQRYRLSSKPPDEAEEPAKTIIVDEASMLTEEMLAALIQSQKGVERLILLGDPSQLPPIGAGRPFVDIIAQLKPVDIEKRFPRVGPCYAELTVQRRQAGTGKKKAPIESQRQTGRT